jgi:hypothetical protein
MCNIMFKSSRGIAELLLSSLTFLLRILCSPNIKVYRRPLGYTATTAAAYGCQSLFLGISIVINSVSLRSEACSLYRQLSSQARSGCIHLSTNPDFHMREFLDPRLSYHTCVRCDSSRRRLLTNLVPSGVFSNNRYCSWLKQSNLSLLSFFWSATK